MRIHPYQELEEHRLVSLWERFSLAFRVISIVALVGAFSITARVIDTNDALAYVANLHIYSPLAGDCDQGGVATTIRWDTNTHHVAISYKSDGSSPMPYDIDSSAYFVNLSDSPSATTYSWTAPTTTISTAKIWIEGMDSSGNESITQGSGVFSIDSSAPTASTVSSGTATTTTIPLSWTTSTDAGCKGLANYKVYRNGSVIATVDSTSTSYTDTSLTANTTYSYYISATDSFVATSSNTITARTAAEVPVDTGGGSSSGGGTTTTDTNSSSGSSSSSSAAPATSSSGGTSNTTTPAASSGSSSSSSAAPAATTTTNSTDTKKTTTTKIATAKPAATATPAATAEQKADPTPVENPPANPEAVLPVNPESIPVTVVDSPNYSAYWWLLLILALIALAVVLWARRHLHHALHKKLIHHHARHVAHKH